MSSISVIFFWHAEFFREDYLNGNSDSVCQVSIIIYRTLIFLLFMAIFNVVFEGLEIFSGTEKTKRFSKFALSLILKTILYLTIIHKTNWTQRSRDLYCSYEIWPGVMEILHWWGICGISRVNIEHSHAF